MCEVRVKAASEHAADYKVNRRDRQEEYDRCLEKQIDVLASHFPENTCEYTNKHKCRKRGEERPEKELLGDIGCGDASTLFFFESSQLHIVSSDDTLKVSEVFIRRYTACT